jgi:hypothetical protein
LDTFVPAKININKQQQEHNNNIDECATTTKNTFIRLVQNGVFALSGKVSQLFLLHKQKMLKNFKSL